MANMKIISMVHAARQRAQAAAKQDLNAAVTPLHASVQDQREQIASLRQDVEKMKEKGRGHPLKHCATKRKSLVDVESLARSHTERACRFAGVMA